MNNVTNSTNSNQPPQDPPPPPSEEPTAAKESEPGSPSPESSSPDKAEAAADADADAAAGEEDAVMTGKDSTAAVAANSSDDSMDEDSGNPATVFHIKLKQPKSNLLHKMSVPELCRTFRCVFEFNFGKEKKKVVGDRNNEIVTFLSRC